MDQSVIAEAVAELRKELRARMGGKHFAPPIDRRTLRIEVPDDFGQEYRGVISTQRAFGQVLTTLARVAPEAAERVVTVSPDVATSTNLGGWINRVGIWHPGERIEHSRSAPIGRCC